MRKLAIGAVIVTMIAPLPVAAESVSTRNQKRILQSQLRVLDSRLSKQYASSARLKPRSDEERPRAYDGSYRGNVWRPSNDKTYTGKMELDGNTLLLAGCVLGGLICADQTWTRIE